MSSAQPQPTPQLPSEGELLRELCNRSFHRFLREFWSTICHDQFQDNWHIQYLCKELQQVAERVANREPNPFDLIINVPPGTTKSIVCSVMFPVWCWTKWPWMRFLTFSYNQQVAIKSADGSKKIIESRLFQSVYPDIRLRKGKEGVTDYEISILGQYGWDPAGGGRFSSSVGGSGTAFHGDILIPDDPLNAEQSFSSQELMTTNRWVDQTLPTRKTNKAVSATIWIQQRLHEIDPSGHLLSKKKLKIKHICLPADISDPLYANLVSPPELKQYYKDGLLDPVRLDRQTIQDLEERLGQYGAAAQLGQNPSPPEGGMFKVDRFVMVDRMPPDVSVIKTVRYWDKAGTDPTKEKNQEPAYTVGVKMSLIANGKYLVSDVVRGRWSAEDREDMILATAQADGKDVEVWTEQEPGSGGKESAEFTVRNLAGFSIRAERPVGNKVARADTFSVQVNRYNVMLLKGEWNQEFKGEYGFFPNSKFKDQVDAGAGAFGKLAVRKQVRLLSRSR